MTITLDQVSKRYGRNWIIRELTETFKVGETIGIKGRNGSGKSTFLRLLAGQLTPSRGKITITDQDGRNIGPDRWYRQVAWTGPYLEIVEELSIEEMLAFHFGLKPLLPGINLRDIPARIELSHARKRKLSDCSSGMRQRVLLATALYADTPLLLLDEPTVTLDEDAVAWYHGELERYGRGRLVIVASNDTTDLRGITRFVDL